MSTIHCIYYIGNKGSATWRLLCRKQGHERGCQYDRRKHRPALRKDCKLGSCWEQRRRQLGSASSGTIATNESSAKARMTLMGIIRLTHCIFTNNRYSSQLHLAQVLIQPPSLKRKRRKVLRRATVPALSICHRTQNWTWWRLRLLLIVFRINMVGVRHSRRSCLIVREDRVHSQA